LGGTTTQTSTAAYPFRGCFQETGYSDYRVRVSSYTSGSTTPVITVSPGSRPPYRSVFLEASASTANTWAPCTQLTTVGTNAKSCKTTAGNLHGLLVVNPATTAGGYIRFYNTATDPPTCSSATGFLYAVLIPPGGFSSFHGAEGFSSGIGWCVTGGSSSTDTSVGPGGVTIKALVK
jgi:hypothetical protein